MPQVPTMNGPQVALQSGAQQYQRSRANPDTFGASVGRGMQRAAQIEEQSGRRAEQVGRQLESNAVQEQRNAQGLLNIASDLEQWQDRLDETAAKEADNLFSSEIRKTMYEGEGAFYTKKGRNALDALPTTQEALEKARQQTAQKLTPNQQRLFNDVAARRLESEFEQMARYRNREQMVWENETSEARVFNSIQEGAVNFAEPNKRKQALATGLAEIGAMAERNGWDNETTKMQVLKYTSGFHVGVMEKMQLESPAAAASYLNRNEKEMMPEVVTAARRSIENADITIQAQSVTDQIFSEGGTIQEQLAKARKLEGKLEDQAVRRIKERWSEMETDVSTDQEVWYGLRQSIANGEDVDLIEHRDKLSDSDFQSLAEKQMSAGKDKGYYVRSETQVINDGLRNVFGISPDASAKVNKEDREFRQEYYRGVQERIDLWQSANQGKKPTPDDLQGIVDEYTLEISYKGEGRLFGMRDKSIRLAEITTEELAEIVPSTEVPAIEAALRRRGIANPTPSLIAQVYLQTQRQ